MEQRQQLLLQLGTEVDQQIATGENVQLGEWRVHDHVLRGEHHHLADFLADPVTIAVFDEKPLQALRRHIGNDVGRIEGLARPGDGIRIEVGGEDLQLVAHRQFQPFLHFAEGDGQ